VPKSTTINLAMNVRVAF